MQTTQSARPINKTSDFDAAVDIVVPFHGEYHRVTELIDSVFRFTRSNHYRLYVVDDCSPNAHYGAELGAKMVRAAERRRQPRTLFVHRTEVQRGFAGACRAGFEMGENPYVCFLNSDCLVTDLGWLRALGEALLRLKPQGVRVVAPLADDVAGGDPAQQATAAGRDLDDVVLGPESHLSLYGFLCHRELFARVGGFLREYPFGLYEDQEFAARLHKHGYRQAVCRRAWLKHAGAATITRLWRDRPDTQKVMTEDNRARCLEDLRRLAGIAPAAST